MTIITNITKTKNFLSKRFGRRYEKFCIFIALGLLFPPRLPKALSLLYRADRNAFKRKQNMPSVRIKENEPFDVALRRFKRSCEKAGILAKVRSCEFYEKPTWERKRKAAAAIKRNQKKVSRESRKFSRLY